jgi:hypothetical protein
MLQRGLYLPHAALMIGGGTAPTGLTVDITPTAVHAGGTLTCNPSASGATSYTYQWTNNNSDIGGATSATFANDGSYGSNAINCTVVAHNGFGDSAPAEKGSDVTIRWAGYLNFDNSGATTERTVDTGSVMPGQVNWLIVPGATPAGNLTFEGVGPTAIASHADYKGQASGGGRTAYVWSNSSTDQVIQYTLSSNWGGTRRYLFKSVGFSATPASIIGGGQSSGNTTPTTINLDVPDNGVVLAACYVYDGLDDPTSIAHYTGSTFLKQTSAATGSSGVGYLASANASLGVTATKASGAVSGKMVVGVVLTPL